MINMSKYIYIDGEIHIKSECFYEDLKINAKKVIEFDRFEDLIEVGDLITYMCLNGLSFYEETRLVARVKETHIWCTAMELREGAIIEIYKHIGKDFIRVCHRENGSWVID